MLLCTPSHSIASLDLCIKKVSTLSHGLTLILNGGYSEGEAAFFGTGIMEEAKC